MSFLKKFFSKENKAEKVTVPTIKKQSNLDNQSNEQQPIPLSSDPVEEEVYEVVEREIHPAKIICPDCGGITLEGLEFCDKCGGELL